MTLTTINTECVSLLADEATDRLMRLVVVSSLLAKHELALPVAVEEAMLLKHLDARCIFYGARPASETRCIRDASASDLSRVRSRIHRGQLEEARQTVQRAAATDAKAFDFFQAYTAQLDQLGARECSEVHDGLRTVLTAELRRLRRVRPGHASEERAAA